MSKRQDYLKQTNVTKRLSKAKKKIYECSKMDLLEEKLHPTCSKLSKSYTGRQNEAKRVLQSLELTTGLTNR